MQYFLPSYTHRTPKKKKNTVKREIIFPQQPNRTQYFRTSSLTCYNIILRRKKVASKVAEKFNQKTLSLFFFHPSAVFLTLLVSPHNKHTAQIAPIREKRERYLFQSSTKNPHWLKMGWKIKTDMHSPRSGEKSEKKKALMTIGALRRIAITSHTVFYMRNAWISLSCCLCSARQIVGESVE